MTTPHVTADTDASILPPPLRAVLYSPLKTELLCLLDESPNTCTELASRLRHPLSPNTINGHLRDLEGLGWIRVSDYRQGPRAVSRVWDLTDRSVSWRSFVAATRGSAPAPIAA